MSDVRDFIPHREPFLFVDEVIERDETKLWARRTVRADEPQFRGHYPGNPIMPGVLLCEAVLQAGCLLIQMNNGGETFEGTPVVTRMSDVKFKRMVKPGDVIDLKVEHERTLRGAHFMKGRVILEGKLAASLGFCVMVAKPNPDAGQP